MLRRLRTPFIILACTLVLALSVLVVVAKHYEPEVKATLERALNERLNAPVQVGAMDLTLIARFPMASLRLHDVLAMELRTDQVEPDTLLFASEIHLEFSLMDLFRGIYTVDKIHASTILLQPGFDTNGAENFRIWKTDSTTTTSAIALNRVSFDQLGVRFRDDRNGLEVLTRSRTLEMQGRFTGTLNELVLMGDVHLTHWLQGTVRHLSDRDVELRLEVAFGGPTGDLHISHGELTTGNVPLEFTLDLTSSPDGPHLDLRANGLGLPLAEAVALLPDPIAKRSAGYGMQGAVDLAVRYEGQFHGAGPELSVGARIMKGRMKEKSSGVVLSEIQGDLALELNSKGDPRKLLIKDFSARSGSGSIRGNWSSTGLTNAELKAELQGDIALADLMRFAQVDTLEQVSGHLKANARIEGRIRDIADLRATDLRSLRIEGTAQLQDASLKLKGIQHRVEQLDAQLELHGNDASIKQLHCIFQGNDLALSGELKNLVPYLLFNDQRLTISADLASPLVDLAALLRSGPKQEADREKPAYRLVLPSLIELDLHVRVEKLVFEEFQATALSGTVRMKDRVLRAAPMTFATASGAVLGTMELDARSTGAHGYPLSIDATFQEIDIAELFREFQDFGQDFIGHRHLSGRSQARVAFRAPLSPGLTLDMNALICTIDIAIDNGGVRGHEPLLVIADHLRKNKLVAPFVDTEELRRRLADVRFSRLENRIEIRNNAVYIPTMEVKSTAMDIELSGTHWFDDRIDHHINFKLGDLFRLGKPQRDEFGPILDDGTGMRIFLHMYGTASDPQFDNDGALAAERRRRQFQQEKQELRSILREDLGLFKGKPDDAFIIPPRTDQPRTQVMVEWDPIDSSTAGVQKTKPKPKKGLGRLLDNPDEKAPPVKIIVED